MKSTQRAALQIALKAGVLHQCTRHWVYFKSRKANALEHAFRLGNYLISRFAKSVKCFKGDRKLLADSIVKSMKSAPDHCQQCSSETQSATHRMAAAL